MNIGSLTVGLLVKGGDTAKKSLQGIGKSMGEVKNTSFQTKAAIAGMVYGLQKMMSWSMNTGTGLEKFNRETGMSVKMLQRWQHAGRAINMTNSEIEGSFRGLQSKMSDYANGLTEITGMHRIGELTGGIDKTKLKDTEYVMKKLQEYARAESDIGRANSNLASFGLSNTMVGGLRKNSFNDKSMKGADTFSSGESKRLAKMSATWLQLQQKINMSMSRFFSANGDKIMEYISKFTELLLKLVDALTKLSLKMKLFEKLAKFTEGLTGIVNASVAGYEREEKYEKENKDQGFFSNLSDTLFGPSLDYSGVESSMKAISLKMQATAAKNKANSVTNNNVSVTVESKEDPIQQGSTIGKEVSKIINREESTTRGN
jgi:hypothetical protein